MPAPFLASAPIVLVGPMGAGKTTLGRALAARLARTFVDLDACIEAEAGQVVAAIFAQEGEAGFRRREAQALAAALETAETVIATGGGAVLDAGNRAAMRAKATVVYLTVAPALQLERLRDDRSRPLLEGADPATRLAQLQAQREPLYREAAHLLFDAGTLAPDAAAAALAARLAQHAAVLA